MDLTRPCRDKGSPTQPGGGADNGNMMSSPERQRKDFADGPAAKTAASNAGTQVQSPVTRELDPTYQN